MRIRDVDALRKAPLYTLNEYETDIYLSDLHKQGLSLAQRVEQVARQNIGQPYELYVLGEHPYELYDMDPMYCLTASDCVTFVEHTYAMALSDDWTSFFRTLQKIRYREGRIGFITRNHFTEADWNVNNTWLFKDITTSLGEGDAIKVLNAKIDRSAFFLKFGIKAEIPVQQFDGNYLGIEYLPKALEQLATGDVIEIVKGDTQLQSVTHMGLAMVDQKGRVTLLHSTKPRVVELPLEDYIAKHKDIMGIKVLRAHGNIPKGGARPPVKRAA